MAKWAKVPDKLWYKFLVRGLPLLHQGKVRDTYILPGHPDLLLQRATQRLSIFDFVLNTWVEYKDEVLVAQTIFMSKLLDEAGIEHHIVTYGAGIDAYLPEELRGNPELQKTALIIKKIDIDPVEWIVRNVLTGSAWESYKRTGTIFGQKAPEDLINGSILPFPYCTPTTKADSGHDEPINLDEAIAKYGKDRVDLVLRAAKVIADYLAKRGLVFADTKFEVGILAALCVIGDEFGTTDCSRIFKEKEYNAAHDEGELPQSWDKEIARRWGKTKGIDLLNPDDPQDVAKVHGIKVPRRVTRDLSRRMRHIFYCISGARLEDFQREVMGIASAKVRIDVIIGSDSDFKETENGILMLERDPGVDLHTHIISCHRNPKVLKKFAKKLPLGSTVVYGGGKAFAAPGVLAGWFARFKNPIPVIGVALGKGDKTAAMLSISELPGQTVIMDQGIVPFYGSKGFVEACKLVRKVEGFQLIPDPATVKKAMLELAVEESSAGGVVITFVWNKFLPNPSSVQVYPKPQ